MLLIFNLPGNFTIKKAAFRLLFSDQFNNELLSLLTFYNHCAAARNRREYAAVHSAAFFSVVVSNWLIPSETLSRQTRWIYIVFIYK